MTSVASALAKVPRGWIAISVRVVSVGLLFLLNVFLARWLGTKEYEYYAIITVWVNLSVLLVKGGLDTAALRFISAYKVEGKKSLIRGFLQFSVLWVFSCTLLIYIIAAIALNYFPILPVHISLWSLSLLVLLLSLSQIRRTVLLSYKRLVLAEFPEAIAKPFIFLVVAAVSLHLGVQGTVAEAIHLSWILTLFGFLIGGLVLWRLVRVDISAVSSSFNAGLWLSVSMVMLVNTGLHQVIKSFDILILGGYRAPEEVAVYAASSRVADLVVFGLSSLNLMVAPRISALYTSGDLAALREMLRKTAWFVFGFAVAVFIFFCMFGEWLLGFYGDSFRAGFVSLIILAGAQVFNSSTGSIGFLLSMTGHHKVALSVMIISALVSVPLYYVLIPLYGAVGAAISSSVGIVIWNSLMLLYSCRVLGINPSIYLFIPVKDIKK